MRPSTGSKTWMVAAAIGLVAGFLTHGLFQGTARGGSSIPAAVGIAALHARDHKAMLSGDVQAMSDLWTEDAVLIRPDGEAEVGRAAITADDARLQERRQQGWSVLRYEPDIRGVSVHGDWAVEWGYFDFLQRGSAKAKPTALRGRLLRVLRRENDGKWRFARVMWSAVS